MPERVLRLQDGREFAADEKGYLLDPAAWVPEVAEFMAREDGIELSPEHRAVIAIFRDYFADYEIEPPMRALVKLVGQKLGDEKANSRYLYRLFPQGPTTQATRYAGLPRPLSCI